MKIHRFADIGKPYTVNINHITHFWSHVSETGRAKITIHSFGGAELSLYRGDDTSEHRDAKELRDQLTGGWHDLKFESVGGDDGPLLSINPEFISGFNVREGSVSLFIMDEHTINRREGNVGYKDLLRLREKLITGTRGGDVAQVTGY